MKIRIHDHSLRLRITLRELEDLHSTGRIERSMQVVTPGGPGPKLIYALALDDSLAESAVLLEGLSIEVRLSRRDAERLATPSEEGVYLRREWIAPDGTPHRFMAFVEKDRPGSTCEKKEQWIYDAPPHGEPQLRPIPRA